MFDPQTLVNRLQQTLNNDSTTRTAKDEKAMDNETFNWTLEQLQESVDGELIGPLSNQPIRFSSVSTDTRTIEPGALYIALKGEQFDGHSFIAEAVRQGAVAVLLSQAVDSIVPGVLVNDTRLALGQFANWHRKQMPVKTLIGVTGSNGKTTVKTMLADLFAAVGQTLATQGNLNNDYGVPRTLLELRPEHEFAIIEMGANHQDEIRYLTLLAEPDITILNNASDSHLEGFGSLQGVIETKGEIFLGLNRFHQNGVAIINADSPGFSDWQATLKTLEVNNVVTFGTAESASVALKNMGSKSESIEFDLFVNGAWQTLEMPIMGTHNAMNAAACTAAALAAGLSWPQIKTALEQFTGVAGRLQRYKIRNGWLLDDSYNANPSSVKVGIDALVALPGKVALCLGAMAELGEQSRQAHEEIAEYANHAGVSRLYVIGEATKVMPKMFGIGATYYKTHEAMVKDVKQAINQEWINHVLVKGSRSAKMEIVAKGLMENK